MCPAAPPILPLSAFLMNQSKAFKPQNKNRIVHSAISIKDLCFLDVNESRTVDVSLAALPNENADIA